MNRVVAFVVLSTVVSCCSAGVPGPPDGLLLTGSVVDAETGEPVSREGLYLHFFCDEIDYQLTLDPAAGHTFAVRVPRPKVRIRCAGSEGIYRLYEETIAIEGESAEHAVSLTPTHYVRLHGKFTDLTTGRPAREGHGSGIGDTPLLAFLPADGDPGGRLRYGADGTYSVRVPRVKLRVSTLDTPLAPRVRELDLSGFEGDEYEFDVGIE